MKDKQDKKITLEFIANEISRLKGELAIEIQLNKDQSYISNLKYEISRLENKYDDNLMEIRKIRELGVY